MPLELVRLTSARLAALPRRNTVFFFPVGPIEDHGPHLPLGLDLLEAEELCRRAAARLENELPGWVGVIAPTAPLGIDSNTQGVALTARAHVLRDWLVDACKGLGRAGFAHFVCFSGHAGPKQLTAIEEAGMMIYRRTRWIRLWRRLMRKGGGDPLPSLVSAVSASIPAATVRESPLFLDAREHGGRRDTSVALAVAPDAVDPAYASLPERAWAASSHYKRAFLRLKRGVSGYWGKPAEANAGWGQGELKGSIDEVFPKLRAMLEGADPNLLFRSWYSVIPPNRTFFKSWVLALSFFFVLLGWMFLNLMTALGRGGLLPSSETLRFRRAAGYPLAPPPAMQSAQGQSPWMP